MFFLTNLYKLYIVFVFVYAFLVYVVPSMWYASAGITGFGTRLTGVAPKCIRPSEIISINSRINFFMENGGR
mgnify:CR=1 FL=1